MADIKTKNKIYWVVIALALGFISGLLVSDYVNKPILMYKYITKVDTLKQVDTIINIVRYPVIKIEKSPAKIIYVKDTVIQTKPFIASIDTILKPHYDTLKVEYLHPESVFNIKMLYSPRRDTVYYKYLNIITERSNKEEWWEKPVWVAGSVLVGYLLGRVR